MAKNTFQRYEKKFLLTLSQLERLLPRLLEHGMVYDKYCTDGGIYTIYNVYYDDETSSVIRDSIRKPKPDFKQKLRMRSYETPASPDSQVFLELKKKAMGVVLKRRVKLTYSEALAFANEGVRPQTDDYSKNRMLDEFEYYFKTHRVKPTLYLSYERIALFDKDNKDFRITFDNRIITRRYDLELGYGSYGENLLHEQERVMEIKIISAVPKWLSDILSEEKIYMSGFTKYGNEFRNSHGSGFTHIDQRKTPEKAGTK